MDDYRGLIDEILDKQPSGYREVLKIRDKYAKKYRPGRVPSFIQLILMAKKDEKKELAKMLKTKPVRESSGVNVVAVMAKPAKCEHGTCMYCPGGLASEFGDTPQSYTGKEPASMRAGRNMYSPYLQIFNRLEQYLLLGNYPGKVELIIMGGTFNATSIDYQNEFIRDCLMALNDFGELFLRGGIDFERFIDFFELSWGDLMNKEKIARVQGKILEMIKNRKSISLETVQKENETALIRCVGMVLETRPDFAMQEHIDTALKQGFTRVELGVQTLDNSVLKFINRGHDVERVITATRLLKDACYKVGYQYMLGLPGVGIEEEVKMFKSLFSDDVFKPDALKLYPCIVIKGTGLYKLWEQGDYKPLTTDEAVKLIAELKKTIPKYCRVMRIQRDIPGSGISAGVDRTNLRQYVQKFMKKEETACRCLRCRQYREGDIKNPVLKRFDYNASKGDEVFLSMEESDKVIGYLRLRNPYKLVRKEIDDKTALIRELHVYGRAVPVGGAGGAQHQGFGRRLLAEAERIALEELDKKKMIVISGIGAREYYLMLGYKREGEYMGKRLG